MSRYTIYGAGAIGGTIGAYLAQSGHDVLFVDSDEEHVRAINESGLAIEGQLAAFTVNAPAVTPAGFPAGQSAVLLAVKAHHTEEALLSLVPRLAPGGWIASFQNGLNESVIAGRCGPERTVGAFVNFGADYLGPGRVHYGGRGAVVVGEIDGADRPRSRTLHADLLHFAPHAVLTANIWGYLWAKLAYGALLFATAVTDEPIADVLASPPHRPALANLAAEVLAVAAAEGVRPEAFDGFDPNAYMGGAAPSAARSLDALVDFNRRSAKTHSGIWRDLAVRRRRTEVEPQLGVVPIIAARHGLATPLVGALVEVVRELEAGAPRAWANLDRLSALDAQVYPNGFGLHGREGGPPTSDPGSRPMGGKR